MCCYLHQIFYACIIEKPFLEKLKNLAYIFLLYEAVFCENVFLICEGMTHVINSMLEAAKYINEI